jgi:HK97 family phage major capsid protein
MPADTEVIGEFQKIADKMHADQIVAGTKTVEECQALVKKHQDEAVPALLEKFKTEIKTDLDTRMGAQDRLIKERTARPPSALLGTPEGDTRSLGTRFAELDQYKAWAATDHRSKAGLQLSIKGRIRQPLEVKVAGTIVETGLPMLPTRVGFFGPPTLPLVMRDVLTVVTLSSGNAIEYVLETWNYAADYQLLEGDKKAQGDVTYQEKTANVRTIAWYVKVSRQMMADAPYFASTVDSQLLYGLAKKEDHEILVGSGAAGHLLGIVPQATPLPVDVLADILNSFDQVLAAVAYLSSIGYVPTAIVLNPIDWANMQIAKTAQGIYILGGPPSGMAARTLWGLPVVMTSEMAVGTFLVGAFPPNATLFDRESPSVDISYENEDDFVKNLVTIRAEERIALAVYRPQAFVTGSLTVTTGVGVAASTPSRKKE